MDNKESIEKPERTDDAGKLVTRRDFLVSLRKWSTAVIGIAAAGGVLLPGENAAGWVNSRGTWVNGGGGGWVNRKTTWVNGGGGGTGWVNRAGGGGTAWVNRRGW